jgi:hypothetical protein
MNAILPAGRNAVSAAEGLVRSLTHRRRRGALPALLNAGACVGIVGVLAGSRRRRGIRLRAPRAFSRTLHGQGRALRTAARRLPSIDALRLDGWLRKSEPRTAFWAALVALAALLAANAIWLLSSMRKEPPRDDVVESPDEDATPVPVRTLEEPAASGVRALQLAAAARVALTGVAVCALVVATIASA